MKLQVRMISNRNEKAQSRVQMHRNMGTGYREWEMILDGLFSRFFESLFEEYF